MDRLPVRLRESDSEEIGSVFDAAHDSLDVTTPGSAQLEVATSSRLARMGEKCDRHRRRIPGFRKMSGRFAGVRGHLRARRVTITRQLPHELPLVSIFDSARIERARLRCNLGAVRRERRRHRWLPVERDLACSGRRPGRFPQGSEVQIPMRLDSRGRVAQLRESTTAIAATVRRIPHPVGAWRRHLQPSRRRSPVDALQTR